jgi:hypothetical protein
MSNKRVEAGQKGHRPVPGRVLEEMAMATKGNKRRLVVAAATAAAVLTGVFAPALGAAQTRLEDCLRAGGHESGKYCSGGHEDGKIINL